MNKRARSWAPTAVGLVGSALVAYAAPRALADPQVRWWYTPGVPAGRGASLVLVWAGMAILCGAWLWLGRALPSQRRLLLTGAVWMVPLALAPPLFSRDVYSYLAQGTILHLGHSPYHDPPSVLAALGRPHVLAAVSPFWRETTAPYGPLFLGLVSVVVGAVGQHLVAGVLVVRGLGLLGAVLLAWSVPLIARALGSDPRRALWLALLSPLVTLQLVAAAHNDLLMAGLLAAGVAVALSGRPLAGIGLCALAATVKVPALAGAVFIAVAWGRAEIGTAARVRFGLAAAAVTAAVLGAVTLATGAGIDWLSSALFSTPAKVRLAITPATAVGYTLASLLRDVGVPVSERGLEGVVGVAAFVVTAGAGVVLLSRVRVPRLVPALGGFLLLAAAGGPAAWPWYFVWGLSLVAAVPAVQRRSAVVGMAVAAAALVIKPDGILALPRSTAPAVLLAYVLIGLAAWHHHRRHRPDRTDSDPPTPSALADRFRAGRARVLVRT